MSAAKVAAALIAAEKNNLTQPAAIPAQGCTQHKQKNNTKGKKHRDTHRTITIRNLSWIHRILAYWGGVQMITAIDPGTTESAILTLREGVVINAQILPNDELLRIVRQSPQYRYAVEMIACYGMPVGREVFETCLIIGRLQEIIQAGGGSCRLVYRRDVKIWLCGTPRAKDPNIAQALRDKYGDSGTKKNPGKIYGVKSHLWAALAVADYALGNPV